MIRKRTKGFTLIETLMVISILSGVGIALSISILNGYRGNAYVFEAASSVDNARRGLSVTIQNLREASYGEDGAYPVASAATSTITFYADVDQDGPVEKVRVYLSNGTLYRGVTNAVGTPPSYVGQPETVQTVVAFVRNAASTPLFAYYNSAGVALTAPINVADIAFVTMNILTDLNPARAPNVYTLSGSATLRNLRDN